MALSRLLSAAEWHSLSGTQQGDAQRKLLPLSGGDTQRKLLQVPLSDGYGSTTPTVWAEAAMIIEGRRAMVRWMPASCRSEQRLGCA